MPTPWEWGIVCLLIADKSWQLAAAICHEGEENGLTLLRVTLLSFMTVIISVLKLVTLALYNDGLEGWHMGFP